jgi:hypothetical protein
VCAHASAADSAGVRLSVHLGDPAKGGIGLAEKRLRGIEGEQGSCAWFRWTPRERGNLSMRAVLHEGIGDPRPANNRGMLEVKVLD